MVKVKVEGLILRLPRRRKEGEVGEMRTGCWVRVEVRVNV